VGDLAEPQPSSLGSRALRNTALLLSGRVTSRLLALVTVIATARHLNDAGFGRFQTVVTYVALVSVLIDLGFNTLYTREAARQPDLVGRFLRNVLSTRLLFAVLGLLVLAVALAIPRLEDLFLPAFAVMLLSAYANVLRSTFYATGRLGYEAVAVVLESILLLGLVLLGVVLHEGIAYFLWAYALQYLFSCVYFAAVLHLTGMVRFGWEFDLPLFREWFWKALPFALTFVLTTIYFKIDVPILQVFRPFTEVGWYSLAYKPIEAILFLPSTIFNVVFPVLSVYFHREPERLPRAIDQFYRALLALGWPITVGVVLLSAGISDLFRLYPQSEVALQILGAGIFLMFVTNAFIGALNAMDRQVLFTWAALVSLVVNVMLNLILIPPLGYLGSAWATDLTEVALLAVCWFFVARHGHRVALHSLSWRILLAGVLMGLVLLPMRSFHGPLVLVAILVGMAVYGFALLLLRAVSAGELGLLRRALVRR